MLACGGGALSVSDLYRRMSRSFGEGGGSLSRVSKVVMEPLLAEEKTAYLVARGMNNMM